MTIECYLNGREMGMTIEEIQEVYILSEATVWTFELGYQCYLRNIPLNKAIELIRNS